jgi:TPR repeat protein
MKSVLAQSLCHRVKRLIAVPLSNLGATGQQLRFSTNWKICITIPGISAIVVIGLIAALESDGHVTVISHKEALASFKASERNNSEEACSYGQIEDMKAGDCVWTTKWEVAEADKLANKAANARLDRVSQHLSDGNAKIAMLELEPLLLAGNARAQRFAGVMYLMGHGVKADQVKAHHLLELSAQQKDPAAKFLLAELMTEECVDTCPQIKEVLPLLKEASEGGVHEATEMLAKIYADGIWVPRDIDAALPFIKSAAEAGLAESQRVLGAMHFDGDHVPQSNELALEWYEKSALQKDEVAMQAAGLMYLTGKGVDKDVGRGFSWLWLGAYNGAEHAQFVVGETLYRGILGITDSLHGLMWLKVAARNGSEKAAKSLAGLSDELNQTQRIISDLMAEDCWRLKRCGVPPWELEPTKPVDPASMLSTRT